MGSARSSGAAQELLEPAWRMRWRVPELCLMLSDRAIAEARRAGDRTRRLRGEALALFALNRLSRGVTATARAIAAVLEAEKAGDDIADELRVELATCARTAGSHEVALRVLHPVLHRERIEPVVRAHALLEQAASLTLRRDSGQSGDALDEAERLYSSVKELNRDTSRLLRARVCTARACHHRRNGDFTAALEASVTGLELVRRLGDPAADSGEVHARLVLEQVHSLLDLGQRTEAMAAAEAVLHQPVRAAAAGPSGWLRLAMATRVHLADGGHGAVVMMLNEAVAHAERHKLDGLLAEALSTLSYVHERGADFAQALRCLRNAYSAERRWRAAVQTARVRLLEDLPTLSDDVPRQRVRRAEPSPAAAEPDPIGSEPIEPEAAGPEPTGPEPAWPSAAPADAPALAEPPRTTRSGRRRADGNVHEAARRLMETLTSRANSTGAENAAPAVPAWRPEEDPADVDAAPPAAPGSASDATGAAKGATLDWTTMLPRLSRSPREPAGGSANSEPSDTQDAPLFGTSPASLRDNADTEITDAPRAGSEVRAGEESPDSLVNGSVRSRAGDTYSAVLETVRRPADDFSGPTRTMPGFPVQPPDAVGWPPESTMDESLPAVEATMELSRVDSVPDGAATADERARVKSLAEIRASLQRIQERSRLRPPVAGGDAERARQPDSGPPASEVGGPPAAASDAGADEPRRTRHSEPPEDPSPVDSVRGDAGLADLLAEALVAYETGRRGEETQRRQRAPDADSGRVLPDFRPSLRAPYSGDTDSGETNAGGTGVGETQAMDTGAMDMGAMDTGAVDMEAGNTDAGNTGAGDTGAGSAGTPRARHRRPSPDQEPGPPSPPTGRY